MRIVVVGVALVCMLTMSAAAQEETPMERNSKVFDYFIDAADNLSPKLAWNATSAEEHEAWRKEFKPKLLELLGRSPEPVPLEVQWDEKKETDRFVRHKIYVRSEKSTGFPLTTSCPRI